jgi:hypothetical protein
MLEEVILEKKIYEAELVIIQKVFEYDRILQHAGLVKS